MKRAIISYLLLFLSFSLSAQDRLTLEKCQELSKANYPMVRQLDLIDRTQHIKQSNLTHVWFPKLSLSTSAVTTAGLPEITPITDGLKENAFLAIMSVNFVQPIWDGGISIAQKKIVKADAEVQRADIEVSLHKLEEQVSECYFSIVLLREQLKLSEENLQLIKRYLEQGKVLEQNGVIGADDVKTFEIEVLHQEQQVASIGSALACSVKVLSRLIGKELPMDINLAIPTITPITKDVFLHPKFQFFSAQENYITAKERLTKTQCVPKLSLNVNYLGLTPTPKVMNNGINNLWYAGITLSWNISPLYSLKNDLTSIDIERQSISTLKSSFEREISIALEKEEGEVVKLTHLLEKDKEIVNRSNEIVLISESRLKNGTINTTDFLKVVNNQFQAKQLVIIHEIELLNHQYNQRLMIGQQ